LFAVEADRVVREVVEEGLFPADAERTRGKPLLGPDHLVQGRSPAFALGASARRLREQRNSDCGHHGGRQERALHWELLLYDDFERAGARLDRGVVRDGAAVDDLERLVDDALAERRLLDV